MTRTLRSLCLVGSMLLAGSALAAQKDLDRSFTVASGGRLNVEADGATISVTGTDAKTVSVRIRASGDSRQIERLNLSAERDGNGVNVLAKREGAGVINWFGGDLKVGVTVEVPRDYNLQLATSGGEIKVSQVNGTAIGRTSGGRVSVDGVRGEVRMKSSGGGIEIRNVEGPTEIDTSGGSIVASNIRGRVRAHTSGGPIRLEGVSGAIDADTSGGSINIDLQGENAGIVAKTSGGSISLRVPSATKAQLNASTSGGSVKCDLPLGTSDVGKTSLRGALNGGGPEILARTSGGSIRISGS